MWHLFTGAAGVGAVQGHESSAKPGLSGLCLSGGCQHHVLFPCILRSFPLQLPWPRASTSPGLGCGSAQVTLPLLSTQRFPKAFKSQRLVCYHMLLVSFITFCNQ